MEKATFRKVSIERLSSPEQLDRIITVTNTRSWLLLAALGLILAAVVVWSITGSLATSVTAKGMLVKSGGIMDISSSAEGRISDIRVRPGDFVKKGDIVARLEQSEMIEEITALSGRLKSLEGSEAGESEAIEMKNRMEELKKRLKESSVIISQQEGRAVEVKAKVGDRVSPGTAVMSIMKEGAGVKDLIAVIYVPVESGKRLAPGMEARISPSTVKKEEFGYILGRIVSVSEYPVTVQTARERLGSSELAQAYAGGAACLEVLADLVTDEKTESGYRWSTLSGPSHSIENGTVCTVSVIVDRQRPAEMVVPQIGNLLGENGS